MERLASSRIFVEVFFISVSALYKFFASFNFCFIPSHFCKFVHFNCLYEGHNYKGDYKNLRGDNLWSFFIQKFKTLSKAKSASL